MVLNFLPKPTILPIMVAGNSYPHLFVLLCLLSMHVPHATSLYFSLDFSSSSDLCSSMLTCTNDTFFSSSHMLELTTNDRTRDSRHSVGRAWYAKPLLLWDNVTGELASFTTTFSFQIKPFNDTTGDGMAFFLGHYPLKFPIAGGENLGLFSAYNRNATDDERFVAVVFDTYRNTGEISSNYIGIDVNSIVSVATRDTTSPDKNLTSDFPMTAQVNYNNITGNLTVVLQINDTSHSVSTIVDLRRCLPQEVAVGFSASTGSSAELHRVTSWSFNSTLERKEPQPALPSVPAPQPLLVFPPTSSKHPITSSKPPKIVLFALVLPLSILACVVVGFLLWRQRTRRRLNETMDSDFEERGDVAEQERGVAGPRQYHYRELANATGDFAEEEKLGRGGFGSVYKGHLSDQDRAVAIKMFSTESSVQGRKEFEAEVKILSRLKHRNLVQLLGWCVGRRKGLLLVYELVPEGSLDKHLHNGERLLTWPERYQIILGLGSALRYLHGEWEQCVVHGDIKPSNIMLGSSYIPKLGDFGLARLIDHGTRWQTTQVVLGTAGYIDPEFVNTRRPSTESDVYSFGIVLLEIVSGRRPVVNLSGEPVFALLKWVWQLYGKNSILESADERLRDESHDWEMERVLVVGLWCAHPDRSERPSIAEAMCVLQCKDAPLPALPPQLYKTTAVANVSMSGHAYGALSTETSSGGGHSWATGDTTHSS